jgi:Cysteine-rich secretory protein family
MLPLEMLGTICRPVNGILHDPSFLFSGLCRFYSWRQSLARIVGVTALSPLQRTMTFKARHRLLPVAAALVVGVLAMMVGSGCTQQWAMETNLALGINQMRADNGLPPLTVDSSLASVARDRAEDMAAKGYFSHVPPDGCDYRCLFQKNNISMAWGGEVIAWNNYPLDQTVDVTMKMWLDSPAHFGVITNRCFTRMGTGAAIATDGRIYHVAVFEGLAPGC